MPLDPKQKDQKGNLVVVTLFESYLAEFILENPRLYQAAFLKLFHALKGSFQESDRIQFSIFTLLNTQYPGFNSFESFETDFSLPAADYLLKLAADYMFRPPSPERAFFETASHPSLRSPVNLSREPILFDVDNRGATEVYDEEVRTRAFGIVDESYRPDAFENYFGETIEPAFYYYHPDETSYVAKWLTTN